MESPTRVRRRSPCAVGPTALRSLVCVRTAPHAWGHFRGAHDGQPWDVRPSQVRAHVRRVVGRGSTDAGDMCSPAEGGHCRRGGGHAGLGSVQVKECLTRCGAGGREEGEAAEGWDALRFAEEAGRARASRKPKWSGREGPVAGGWWRRGWGGEGSTAELRARRGGWLRWPCIARWKAPRRTQPVRGGWSVRGVAARQRKGRSCPDQLDSTLDKFDA